MTEEATVTEEDAAEWAYRCGQAEQETRRLRIQNLLMWSLISTTSVYIDKITDTLFTEPAKLGEQLKDLMLINPWLEMAIMLIQIGNVSFSMTDEELQRIIDAQFIWGDIPSGLKEKLEAQVNFARDACVDEFDRFAESNGMRSFAQGQEAHKMELIRKTAAAIGKTLDQKRNSEKV